MTKSESYGTQISQFLSLAERRPRIAFGFLLVLLLAGALFVYYKTRPPQPTNQINSTGSNNTNVNRNDGTVKQSN